jgi:hypothetical protein
LLPRELWNTIASYKDVPNVSISDGYTQVPWNLGTYRTYVPKELVTKFVSPKRSDYKPQGAVKELAHIHNMKPMDSKNQKILHDHFPITTAPMPKKIPALPEHEIYLQHADKIPTDAKGNRHPFLIRTKRLESNYVLSELTDVCESVAIDLASISKLKYNKSDLQPLSIADALAGSYEVTPMDTNSSSGVTLMQLGIGNKKSDAIGPDGLITDPRVLQWTQDQYAMAKKGLRLTFPADANYKSENLLEEKSWKKRVFYNVPIPTIINLKRILGPLQHVFSSDMTKSPYQFKLYPLRDWDTLANSLLSVSNRIVELDAKAYDHSVNAVVITALAAYVQHWYGCDADSPLGLAIAVLLEEVSHMPCIFKNTIVGKTGGVPSGCWGTSLIDAICFDIMLAVIWRNRTFKTTFDYERYVARDICGDDLISAIDHQYSELFNGITISDSMLAIFGIEMTPVSDKSGVIVPYTTLDKASFCSRQFMRFPEHPSLWIPKLKECAISSTLTYSQEVDPYLLYEQYVAIRLEIFPYGREIYTKYESELAAYACEYNIMHYPQTYDACVQIAWQELMSPRLIRNKPTIQPDFIVPVKPFNQSEINMSSTKIKNLRKRIFVQFRKASSLNEFYRDAQSDVKLVTAIPLELYAFDDPQRFIVPGTSDKYDVFRPTSSATMAALCNHFPESVVDLLTSVYLSEKSDICQKSAHHWNLTRQAHIALANELVDANFIPNLSEFVSANRLPHEYSDIFYLLTTIHLDVPCSAPAPVNVVSGGTTSGQLDPLSAPALAITPAQSGVSQEITDGDAVTAPLILATVGGLAPVMLPVVNYADNIVSLCNKPIYVADVPIAVHTAAGTVLESLAFDPWDRNLVSFPILGYGALHSVFSGSLEITLNSYSASTIIGSVIIAYIPPLMQANFSPTLQSMTTLPHTIISLKEGGISKIAFTGGHLQDAAISRARIASGQLFGQVVIMAYTDIANAYGAEVPIPVKRLCNLGADSYFSHPSYLTGAGGGGIPTIHGPVPPVANNLIVDGPLEHDLDLDAMHVSGTKYLPFVEYSDGSLSFCPNFYHQSGNISETPKNFSMDMWFGHNDYGSSPLAIDRAFPNTDEIRGINTVLDLSSQTMSSTVGGPPFTTAPDGSQFEYNGLLLNNAVGGYMCGGNIEDPSLKIWTSAVYTENSPPAPKLTVALGAYDNFKKITDTYDREVATFSFKSELDIVSQQNGNSDRSGTYNPRLPTSDYGAIGSGITNTIAPPSYKIAGSPLCSQGVASNGAPLNFHQLLFERDDAFFIPAVVSTLSEKRSMLYPATTNAFREKALLWFETHPEISSYTYTMSDITGAYIAEVLINAKGAFLYSQNHSEGGWYGLIPSTSSVVYGGYQEYTTQYPTIQATDETLFTDRRVSSKKAYAYKEFNKSKITFVNSQCLSDSRAINLHNQNEIDTLRCELRTIKRALDIPNAAMIAMQGASAVGGAASGYVGMKQWQKEFEQRQQYMEMTNATNQRGQSLSAGASAFSTYGSYASSKYAVDKQTNTAMRIQAMRMGYDANVATAGVNQNLSHDQIMPAPTRLRSDAGSFTSTSSDMDDVSLYSTGSSMASFSEPSPLQRQGAVRYEQPPQSDVLMLTDENGVNTRGTSYA